MNNNHDAPEGVLRKGNFKYWILKLTTETCDSVNALVKRLDQEAEDRRESDKRIEIIANKTLLATSIAAAVACLALVLSVITLLVTR